MTTADDLRAIRKHFVAKPYPDGSVCEAFGRQGLNPLNSKAGKAFFSEWRDDEKTKAGVEAAFDRAIAKAEASG